jgi:hypothetical protein
MRHHIPGWMGESSSGGHHYFTQNTLSASRSRFKSSASRQPDEIALTENGESMHSRTRIVKEIEWNVTEERVDEEAHDMSKQNHPNTSYAYEG